MTSNLRALFFTSITHIQQFLPNFTMSHLKVKSETDLKFENDTFENGILINTILFATKEEVIASIRESTRETESLTIFERVSSTENITPAPILEPSNWNQWCESIQNLIQLTDTSAAFLLDPPRNKALTIWKSWWATLLREAAPDVQTAPNDRPRDILSKIVAASKDNIHSQNMKVIYQFWNLRPKNKSVQSYVRKFYKYFQDLSEHSFVIPGIEAQMRLLLLYHVSRIQPDLARQCSNSSLEETIFKCLQWNSSNPSEPTAPSNNYLDFEF